MKGYEEPTTTFIDILTVIIFTLFVFGTLLSITRFKTEIREATEFRLAIDFGENILSADCLTNIKGVFNETKVNKELEYWKGVERRDQSEKDGISCLSFNLPVRIIIHTKEGEWVIGDAHGTTIKRLPAVLKKESGETIPALLTVEIEKISE